MSAADGQVYVDPVKLEAYSSELEHGCARLEACMAAMKSELSMLGSTWQDAQYQEFRAKLATAAKAVELFRVQAARAQLQLQLDADAARRIHRDSLSGD